jgi:hypothetical protein
VLAIRVALGIVLTYVVGAAAIASPTAAAQTTQTVEARQDVRIVEATTTGERYSMAGYAAIECNVHSYGGDTWASASCLLSRSPFEAEVAGTALSLLTADGRIFVATCKSKRKWWGGSRPCRVPSVQYASVVIVGPNPFHNLKARLRWTNQDSGAVETETYAVLAVLAKS